MTKENILEKVIPLAVGLFEARGIESLAWNIAARGDARCTGSKAHATRDDIKKHSPTADSMPKGSSAAWGSETLSEPEEHNEPVNIHLNVASNHHVSLSR